MAGKFAVGAEFFDKLRKSGSYYVDKTELLYELASQENTVTLFTRPRRFGKTLTMSMIECFFDIRRDYVQTRELFKGLNVMRHEEFCKIWMNQHPVLFLTLKDVEGLTFEAALGMLKSVIANLCTVLSVRGFDITTADIADRDRFSRLKSGNADTEEIKNSLLTLMRMLHAVYNKPVILLIDEYDVPLARAQENGYYRQMLDVIRGLMSTTLKTNRDLEFAVITGCLRIPKESIFTGVNNFASYSVMDEDFSEYFGFTQEEVDRLIKEAEIGDKADTFRQWYDGYIFGSTPLYCPWDVVCYAAELVRRNRARPKNYWKNTSGNGAIRTFIENRQFNVKPAIETLLNGGTITRTITDQLTYDRMDQTEENLWSVLLMTGYLTKADSAQSGETVALRIPNKEIESIFQDTVVRYFADTIAVSKVDLLIDSLWKQDTENASKVFSDLLWQTISYNDYHEDYYHAFLAGIFVGRGYAVESNKERGLGRPDIKMIDDVHRRVMIIEAKKSDSRGQMEGDCDEAIRQIIDEEYAKNLEDYDRVLCYGVAFFKKSALVKELKGGTK